MTRNPAIDFVVGFGAGVLFDQSVGDHQVAQDFVDTAIFTPIYGIVGYGVNKLRDREDAGEDAVIGSVAAGTGYLLGQLVTHLGK